MGGDGVGTIVNCNSMGIGWGWKKFLEDQGVGLIFTSMSLFKLVDADASDWMISIGTLDDKN